MRTPNSVALHELQSSFRDVWETLEHYEPLNPDFHGRRFQNVGDAQADNEWVTRSQGDGRWLKIEDLPAEEEDAPGSKAVRIDAYAARGAAHMFSHTLFEASDRNYIAWASNGANWIYAYGIHQRTQSQLAALAATLGTNDTGYQVWVTDFEHRMVWSGTAWVFAAGDPGSGFVSIGKPTGAVPNGGVWGICDGTAYTVLNADGTTTSLTTQNLTGDVFIKGNSTSGSQQAAARATWEAGAVTNAEAAHTHAAGTYAVSGATSDSGESAVNSGAGSVAVGAHGHSFSASVTGASAAGSSHNHALADANAQLKVPSEANGGVPLRIACVFYMRR
jgi:hypothetical protein